MPSPPTQRALPEGALLIFSDGAIVWDLDIAVDFMARLSSSDQSLLPSLLDHVQTLRGAAQLDDDFPIIEAFVY